MSAFGPSGQSKHDVRRPLCGVKRTISTQTELVLILSSATSATFNANAAANLNACIRARDPGEAYSVLLARIPVNRMQFGRLWWVFSWRTRLLSGDPSRKRCNNGRQDGFSHDQSPVIPTITSYMISAFRVCAFVSFTANGMSTTTRRTHSASCA
jgi:hypothetical protein